MEVHLEIGAEEENSIQEVGRRGMKVAMTPILRLAASGSDASLASVLGAFQPSSYLYPGMSGTRSSRTEAGPHQRLSTECVGKRKICFLLGCFVCSVYGGYNWRCRKLGLRKTLVDYFADEPFVTVLPDGQLPVTASTLGSNAVHIQVAKDDRTNRATVFVALDNLIKGAAGQAVQNANLICGFPETAGLSAIGIAP